MGQYLFLAFVLIVIFLLTRPEARVKEVINSLSSANIGAIMALQGRNPGGYRN